MTVSMYIYLVAEAPTEPQGSAVSIVTLHKDHHHHPLVRSRSCWCREQLLGPISRRPGSRIRLREVEIEPIQPKRPPRRLRTFFPLSVSDIASSSSPCTYYVAIYYCLLVMQWWVRFATEAQASIKIVCDCLYLWQFRYTLNSMEMVRTATSHIQVRNEACHGGIPVSQLKTLTAYQFPGDVTFPLEGWTTLLEDNGSLIPVQFDLV